MTTRVEQSVTTHSIRESTTPFHCQMCGECCSSWNIHIERAKGDYLLQQPWVLARMKETGKSLTWYQRNSYLLPQTDQQTCIFLAEDKRCLIEAHEGRDMKPLECQRYPFAAAPLPNGQIGFDASASCRTIANHLLLTFTEIVPSASEAKEAGQSWLADFNVDEFPQRIKPKPWCLLPAQQWQWADYEQFRQQVHTYGATEHLSAEALLYGAWRLVEASSHRWTGTVVAASFLLPAVSPVIRPWARAWVLRWFLRKPYRSHSGWELLRGQTYHDPKIFGPANPLDLAAVAQMGFSDEPTVGRLRQAFMYSVLNRKIPLAFGHSMLDWLSVATVALILVDWYAQALAWQQGAPLAEKMHMQGAIRLVERYYVGHQPAFLVRFRRNWLLGSLVRFLFAPPTSPV
ncbi:MAG: YkgJ family cysteine cluster protein [Candidatus Melainabacteria bacterium]|nr:YkgJ family cysteine cluster protein [Candidatus Melainabacteria bacterium]